MSWMLPWVGSVIAGDQICIYIFYLSVNHYSSLSERKERSIYKELKRKRQTPQIPKTTAVILVYLPVY